MKPNRILAALLSAALALPGSAIGFQEGSAAVIPAEQLDSLVAPIALYPDPLLAQTLAASTYPLELMQLQQWLVRNTGLKDKALTDAVMKQPWDPSIQAMAALPDVVKRLTDDIQWTTDLGNAFLAQQAEVMDAVQRMRQKAEGTGSLKSTQQQVVETRVIEEKQVIVIEPSSPEVVYVPSYNPTVVYGAPYYPYPSIYYPPVGAYAATAAISFGVGVAVGAAWGGGGWGWNAGWGHNDITVNRNNNFNRNTNINANGNWSHRAEHRGGAPYSNRATADRFGGTARGDSLSNRQSTARQQVNRQGGNVRSGGSGAARTPDSFSNRADTARGDRSSSSFSGSRGSAGSGASRDLSSSGSRSRSGDSFGGGDRFSGSSARQSSSRGSSSFQSRSGGSRSGGFSGGGGSRSGGGGSRGGGGGSRGGGRR